MDGTNATKPVSAVRGTMTYVMGALALLTCPCHLPILLAILSGTAAGSFLSANLGTAALILLPIFLLSAYSTWRLLDTGGDAEERAKGRSPARTATGPGSTRIARRPHEASGHDSRVL
jgi:mercuric ion transport protein